MSKKKEKKQKSIGDISPAQYREFLSKVHLADLSLVTLSSEIHKDKFIPENNPSVSISDKYKIVDFEKNVKAVSTFTLKVQSNKSDDLILSITGSYEILLITDGDIPKSFWNVYKSITLPLKIWPYFRELVQNITSRMNIPPLTLPILYK